MESPERHLSRRRLYSGKFIILYYAIGVVAGMCNAKYYRVVGGANRVSTSLNTFGRDPTRFCRPLRPCTRLVSLFRPGQGGERYANVRAKSLQYSYRETRETL